MSKQGGLAQRSMTSMGWNAFTSLSQVGVTFVRGVLLARLLPVETFGIYGWAVAIVAVTVPLANFGLGGAFLHRAPETADEDETAAVHLTLRLMFSLIWVVVLVSCALVLAEGQTRVALLVLTLAGIGPQLSHTPRLLLHRRVVHRRIAVMGTLNAVLSTVVAVGLAWFGADLWALLSMDITTFFLHIIVFYVWRPVWRPRLKWSPRIMRYFLRFGSRKFLADTLLQGLDRADDLWTGYFLGEVALGYYSRAYAFATYPRRVMARPMTMVASGTYAELKGDRLRLSQAFFRINALLVRSGFLLGGLLALIAPEFILLLLGAKWMPMLDAFRLMLIYTLLDPIKLTIAMLFTAVGRPGQVVKARFVQLVILIAGLFALGPTLGIAGVALAVDAMLLMGIGVMLFQAREHVDFDLKQLFGTPTLALVVALALGYLSSIALPISKSDWYTAAIKTIVFVGIYGGILFLLERNELLMLTRFVKRSYLGHGTQSTGTSGPGPDTLG